MTTDSPEDPNESRPFSLAASPFLRVLHRCHLTRADRTPRAWALVAIAWVPLFVGALLRYAVGQEPAPILFDISVHVRLLVAIPLLIQAERLLEARCRGSMDQLYDGDFADRARVDHIVDRTERLRDARWIELSLLVLVVAFGQSVLWGALSPTGWVSGVEEAGSMSFARIWYVCVALPISHFLLLRWLWHWALWSYVVASISRLPLATIATHPDHAAGIGFLASPVSAYVAFVFPIAATIAAAWGTQILTGHATLQTFVPSFVVFVVLVCIIAVGPQLLFMGALYRARHREIGTYNRLALDYVRWFHDKWIDTRREPEQLLGTPDLQSLNDLCGSYENLVHVRLVPFGPRLILEVWLAALIPMLPLVATTMPLNELLGTIGRALLGGLPG